MIVYRTQQEDIAAGPELERIAAAVARLERNERPDFDDITEQLIDAGELVAAVLDELYARADDLHPASASWIALVTALADASDAAWQHDSERCADAFRLAARAIHTCQRSYVPRQVTRRVSEGFAYYALGPELYAEAARAWRAGRDVERVVCIGLRTIGVTLAAAAAAGLSSRGIEASVVTLRPRDHPFARRLVLTTRFECAIQAWSGATFLIVDEGPGLSGSSIACVADALSALGIEDNRIVLMPAHQPNVAAFVNERARGRWDRHAIVVPDFEHVWISSRRLAEAFAASDLQDIAAGRWRSRCRVAAHAPVHPQHERRKFVGQCEDGRAWVKFAGRGRYGRRTLERAACVSEAGWAPEVQHFQHGWIAMPVLTGCSLAPRQDPAMVDRLAHYLAFIKRSWSTGVPAAPDALLEMGMHNIRMLCGDDGAAKFARMIPSSISEAVRVDGRQFPHEWVGSMGVAVKTDGVDHHDDHFFPGPVDIAWDVAGVLEEWRMDESDERRLLDAYQTRSGDREIATRLRFYRAAYLAFRAGYSQCASEQLGPTEDGERFRAARERYSARLQLVVNG